MRVVTWNLNHWRQSVLPVDTRADAWAALRDELHADIALLQEAVPPTGEDAARHVYGELAGHRAWGSTVSVLREDLGIAPVRAVRMPWSRRHHLLGQVHPGAVAIAQVEIPGVEPIVFVSVYGVMDGSAVGTMLRFAADLLPLFDSPLGARVILAGDFNVSRSTSGGRSRARAEAVLDVIRSLGLVEAKDAAPGERPRTPAGTCGCKATEDCDHVLTWKAAELDHVFLSPGLADQVVAISARPDLVEAGLSDHVPLVLDLELTPERTAHTWDEEAFAVEIGRRHGAAARRVVERLVAWADDRERRMGEAEGVRTKALTRFPMNGETTEPELWFPLDFNLAPSSSQPTFSIRAKGDVILQFGRMGNPPFDTPDGRRPLRRALNAIPGVDIPRWKLNGWPSFPLAALEDREALAAFVAVLDTIVTESRPRPVVMAEVAEAAGAATSA